MASKRNKLCIRLIDSHTGLEPTHDCGRIIARSQPQIAARLWRKLIIQRRPQFLRNRELKIGWHHPDDGRSFAVNSNALADYVWVCVEIASPDFVAEDSDLLCAGFIVLGREIATKHRRDPDNLEKIFGYVTASITLRIVFVSNIDCGSVEIAGHH